jgi:ubiquinone/menaquinone biosynthesis C-methylase UbiE
MRKKPKIYDADRMRERFEKLGYGEWRRYEGSAYRRFCKDLRIRELRIHVKKGMEVLDLGCGPGRFSIELIRMGAKVTLLDLTPKQLETAKRKISRAGLQRGVRECLVGDAISMPEVKDSRFDFVLAYGGVLSFTAEKRGKALSEIRRVLKPRGLLLAEVMSRYGVFREVVCQCPNNVWKTPEFNHFWEVIETGDQPWDPAWGVHFYTGEELKEFFNKNGFRTIDVFAMPSISSNLRTGVASIYKDKKALETLFKVEETLRNKPGVVNSGEFIVGLARKK